jgi:hypothetical protein
MVRLHFLIRHRLPWVAGCLAHGKGYEGLLGLDLSIFWSVMATFRYLLLVASQFNQQTNWTPGTWQKAVGRRRTRRMSTGGELRLREDP